MGNAQQVWEWIGHNLWQIIVIASVFIQIAPIKINPWTTIFKWIGKSLIGETCGKIDSIVSKLDCLDNEVKKNEIDRIRWEILDFSNSCQKHKKHTKEEFKHIIELNDKYNVLLAMTGEQNGVFQAEYRYIKKIYDKLNESGGFLIPGEGDDSND